MSFFSFFSCHNADRNESVSAVAFSKIIEDKKVFRLDVRTPEEYAQGHIAGSVNIDVKATDFEEKTLAQLPKGHTIAVYCRSGGRSKLAVEVLRRNGFKVVELSTGILGWMSEQLPLER